MMAEAHTVMRHVMRLLLLAAGASLSLVGPAQAYRTVQVTDGDSIIVSASGMATGLRVRIQFLDSPELNGRCPEERALAQEARGRLIELVAPGVTIQSGLEFDRYGRLLARVFTKDGRDVADILIEEKLARRYNGTGPRLPWC